MHVARLLHPPCSCVRACARHRAAFGDPLEYDHHPGGYGYVLFGLHTHDSVSMSDAACRGRRLRARVRKSRCVCVQKTEPLAARYSGVPWSQMLVFGVQGPH